MQIIFRRSFQIPRNVLIMLANLTCFRFNYRFKCNCVNHKSTSTQHYFVHGWNLLAVQRDALDKLWFLVRLAHSQEPYYCAFSRRIHLSSLHDQHDDWKWSTHPWTECLYCPAFLRNFPSPLGNRRIHQQWKLILKAFDISILIQTSLYWIIWRVFWHYLCTYWKFVAGYSAAHTM